MVCNLTTNKKEKNSFNIMQINKVIIKFSKISHFQRHVLRVRNEKCSTQMKCISDDMFLI